MEYTVKDLKNIISTCNKQLCQIGAVREHPEVLSDKSFDLEGFLNKTTQCLSMSAHILSTIIDNTKINFSEGAAQ